MANQDIKIVMLGTGTPNAVPDRCGPATAVVIGEAVYLVDFGSNVVRQAEKARQMGIAALAPGNLIRAFCTHLHSDHTVGVADLIFTPWVLDRKEPILFYGPKGLKNMVDHTVAAFAVDIDGRINCAAPFHPDGYTAITTEIQEGVIYTDEQVQIEAFLVHHPPFEAYGYKFTTKDKTVVISGDTSMSENLIKYAQDCDILVHEVISATGVKKRSPEWFAYHTNVHTTSEQLGEIAARANVGTLVLYHQLFMCGENETGQEIVIKAREQEILREIRQNYQGPVFSAKDLDVFF